MSICLCVIPVDCSRKLPAGCQQRAHLVHAARAARSGVAGGDHVTHTLVDTPIGGGDLRLLSHHRLRDVYPSVSARDPIAIAGAVGRLTMIVLLRRRLRLVRKMRRGALESARPPCPRAAHRPVVVPSRVPGGEGSPTPRPVAARGGSSAYAILVALPTWNCCHSILGSSFTYCSRSSSSASNSCGGQNRKTEDSRGGGGDDGARRGERCGADLPVREKQTVPPWPGMTVPRQEFSGGGQGIRDDTPPRENLPRGGKRGFTFHVSTKS